MRPFFEALLPTVIKRTFTSSLFLPGGNICLHQGTFSVYDSRCMFYYCIAWMRLWYANDVSLAVDRLDWRSRGAAYDRLPLTYCQAFKHHFKQLEILHRYLLLRNNFPQTASHQACLYAGLPYSHGWWESAKLRQIGSYGLAKAVNLHSLEEHQTWSSRRSTFATDISLYCCCLLLPCLLFLQKAVIRGVRGEQPVFAQ